MKLAIAGAMLAAGVATAGGAKADEALQRQAAALFGRIQPGTVSAESPQARLGRALFWDTRVSLDGKTACASCHAAGDWGADRRALSIDARAEATSRHSPTVFNSMSQPALRWLGDRKTGADQAEGSLTGSMGFASKQEGVARLAKLDYGVAFRAAYPQDPEPLSARNYGRAIEAYEATLVTPAPFDRFLAGDDGALSGRQKAGLRAFIATGCAGCHNGPLLGGTTFQRFGVAKDYWTETGSKKIDVGRFAATKKEEDRYVFRVPMLRNVAKTAPYFHDGSVDRLDRAVRIMGAVQLGRALDAATVKSIVAFLESLTGDVPAHYAPPGQAGSGLATISQ
ncbi:MAG TPA: cytochrome c peroxidase [Burkholderiales bacterium]|nr:cytochrome c peroxidase [Burkholderiales bacterium]